MPVAQPTMQVKLDGITLQEINMNKIKINLEKKIKLNNQWYKPYFVGNLPPSFGFKFVERNGEDYEGKYEWFNYKGLTYIKE